jgi:uncharacterized protein YkwD
MRRTLWVAIAAMLVVLGALGASVALGTPTGGAAARTPAQILSHAHTRVREGGTAFPSTATPPSSRARPLRTRSCGGAHLQPTRTNLSQAMAATRCLIERERETFRLGLLHSNGSLQRIATSQAREMVIGDYFGDNSLSGSTPMQRIEVSAYASRTKSLLAAQNIGWGTGGLATPAAMVRGWMLSPPHRRIMLTSGYRDIGVGIAPAAPPRLTNGLPGATYTVEFAVRGRVDET